MNIFEMSISGGILILCIILLRCLSIDLLKKRTFVILWEIALLRLLLPITIPMKFSIANLIASLSDNKEVLYNNRDILSQSASGVVKSTEAATIGVMHQKLPVLTIVWLVGAVLFFGIFLFLYRKEYKRMQEALPINNSDFINHWLANKPIKRDIKVMTSDFIATPVTYGIIIPRIILPKIMDLSNTKQLECVMTHELVHIKRFDNMLKFASMIILCMHWFNPLTWVMYFLLNRDLELSCDEKVLSMLGENEKQFYAYTLIGLAEQKARMNVIYNGFGKNAIKERIITIMKYKKLTAMGMALSVIAILASTNVFAAAEKNRDTSSTNSNANSTAVTYEYTTTADPSYAVELELAGEIAKSERFSDYKKFGLSYDKGKGKLIYKKQTVGYFMDETKKNVYTRLTDATGTIGIKAVRDKNYELTGFEEVDFWMYHSNSDAVEQSTDNVPYQVQTKGKGISSAVETSSAMETGGSDADSLKDYIELGVTYSNKFECWIYKDKKVEALIDGAYIYLNEGVSSKESAALQVVRNDKGHIKEIKVISKKQLKALIDASQNN